MDKEISKNVNIQKNAWKYATSNEFYISTKKKKKIKNFAVVYHIPIIIHLRVNLGESPLRSG